jgi:hypothetical protein
MARTYARANFLYQFRIVMLGVLRFCLRDELLEPIRTISPRSAGIPDSVGWYSSTPGRTRPSISSPSSCVFRVRLIMIFTRLEYLSEHTRRHGSPRESSAPIPRAHALASRHAAPSHHQAPTSRSGQTARLNRGTRAPLHPVPPVQHWQASIGRKRPADRQERRGVR